MSGIIPKALVESIRQAADIVEVVGSYVPLKRAGPTYKALCPFHKEKTPSFTVNPHRQIFHCFGCSVGGDVFKFVSTYENIDFPSAVKRVADRVGIRIEYEEASPEAVRARSQRERLIELHAAVAVWWKSLLRRDPCGDPARAYLASRKINPEMADQFSLGFAPDSWDATMNWAKSKGYDNDLLDLAGLTSTNTSGRRFDRFRGRLMFPIADDTGRVVAFSGRLLDPAAKAAKYVNSPENPLFIKGRVLFGLDKTKRQILDARQAVVCEGQLDLMRCYYNGIQNMVAPQGTAFTDHQASLLKRYANEVILCFDADNAGNQAAERSIDMLLGFGFNVRIAAMPAGEDPDSLLVKGKVEDFRRIIAEAPDYTDHLLGQSCKAYDISSPRGRAAVAEKMAAVVRRIADPARKHLVANTVATRLQIPLSVFAEEMKKSKRLRTLSSADAANTPDSVDPVQTPEVLRADPVVGAMLNLLLACPDIVPVVQRQLQPGWLEGLDAGLLLAKLLDAHAHDAWEDAPAFLKQECDDAEQNLLSGFLVDAQPIPSGLTAESYAVSLILALQDRWRHRRIRLLEQEIKSGILGPEELASKSKELLDMVRSRA